MTDVKWIKITTDIFDDEKISIIESMPAADTIIVIWIKLLCLAGKQNNGGVFIMNDKIAYTDEMLAAIFHRKITDVKLALNTFENLGMIEIVDNVVTIPNWSKHQTLDYYEKKKAWDRAYVAEKRLKQKQLLEEKSYDVVRQSNDSSAIPSLSISVSNNKNSNKGCGEKRKEFAPPSVEEVSAYVSEKGYHFDPESFVAFYASKGWMVGNSKMKDWKQACVTWEKRRSKDSANRPSEERKKQYDDFMAEQMNQLLNGDL